MRTTWRFLAPTVAGLIVLAGCGPQAAPTVGGSSDQARATTPKTLRIGVQREPGNMLNPGTQGQMLALRIADAELTVTDDRGEAVPSLAAEAPSVERGTWKLVPDGSMEVTWRLRTNAKWHDGQPFTAQDLVLGWNYLKDPSNTIPLLLWLPSVDRVSAPDPQTFVVHFSRVDVRAGRAGGGGSPFLRPFPRHILGPTFEAGDIEAINNSPHWRDAFVGLGPYRLARWEPGTRMEFVRFDDYFMGRPPLDRVIVSFTTDPNTLLANILAGEVDINPGGVLSPDQAIELRRRWEGTGHEVLVGADGHMRYLEAQLRPEVDVQPPAIRERAVREALYRGTDRQSLVDAISQGLMPVADSWIPPEDPRRASALRDAIAQYPFDPQRAGRDFEALGWSRAPDGVLTHRSGQRFEMEIRHTPDAKAEMTLNVLGDTYKKVGVSVVQTIVSPQRTADREYRSTYPGLDFSSNGWDSVELRKHHSREIGGASNRYAGTNKGAYVNPDMDALIDRLTMTISQDDQDRLRAQMLRIALTDLYILPMYWEIDVVIVGARVKKNVPTPNSYGGETWNLWQWDLL